MYNITQTGYKDELRLQYLCKVKENRNINVAVVEDTEEIRTSLELLINAEPGFECRYTFSDGSGAVKKLPSIKPDVVLMDIHMPGMSGIECVRQLKPILADTQFLMFTVYQDDDNIYEALRCGAVGYLLKKSPPQKIMEAIRDVTEGGSPMSSEIARRIVTGISEKDTARAVHVEALTPRENEILKQLSKGFLYKEIADQLSVSKETIKKHIQNIYKKLHVQNRTEAINKVIYK